MYMHDVLIKATWTIVINSDSGMKFRIPFSIPAWYARYVNSLWLEQESIYGLNKSVVGHKPSKNLI